MIKTIISVLIFTISTTSFAKEFTYESGVYKQHLFEFYVNDNCGESCKMIKQVLSKNIENSDNLMENVFPLAIHEKTLNDRFHKTEYRGLVYDNRQSILSAMNKTTNKTPQLFFNNREMPLSYIRFLDLRKVNNNTVVGNLSVNINGDLMKVEFEPMVEKIKQPTVLDGLEDSPITEITTDSDYKKEKHTAHVAVITPQNKRYIDSGANEGKVINDSFSVLAYGEKKSNDLKWNITFPDLSHLDFEHLAVVVWIENEHREVIQVTGGPIYRTYYE